ncbi:MAG: aminomethyltransferase beta-barrel domain-containing protein, partial [Gemmatimonadota bacterium]
ICFIPDGDLHGFLEREAAARPALAGGGRFEPGAIRDADGREVGTHPGSAFFTVGQRRGLGIAAGEPLYVTAIEDDNTLVVGPEEDLLTDGLEADDVNWLVAPGEVPDGDFRAGVQIRYRSAPAAATIAPGPGRTLAVRFDAPQRAVAPGQSAVVYDGDRVLGGGTIARSLA